MPSSVVRLASQDHERLRRLLRRLCAPGPHRARWRTEFVDLLRAHRRAERDHVLPGAVALGGELADRARGQAEADVELDRLGSDVEGSDLGDADAAAFDELCRRASTLLEHHDATLRADVLAALEATLPRRELRALGGEYQAARDAALQDTGGHEPPPRRLDLSRAELYELARRAGIEGRSGMSRAELIAELQRRQQH